MSCTHILKDTPTHMPQAFLYIMWQEGVDRAVTDYISGMSDEIRHQHVRIAVRAAEVADTVMRGKERYGRKTV